MLKRFCMTAAWTNRTSSGGAGCRISSFLFCSPASICFVCFVSACGEGSAAHGFAEAQLPWTAPPGPLCREWIVIRATTRAQVTTWKLIDFGTVKIDAEKANEADISLTSVNMTKAHDMIGTAHYMSPEQCDSAFAFLALQFWRFRLRTFPIHCHRS